MSAWPRETPVTAAVTAARWVRSAAVDDDLGRRWRANPDPRGRSAGAGDASSLYAGAAGVVLFFLELAAATGHEAYLEDALAGARRLAVTWPEQRDPTFYHGLAGLVFAMAETGWATGDEEVFGAARAAADRLVRDARPLGDGIGWTGDPAQRGDGGIVLALLHAAGILGVPAYEEVAIEAGHRIAALAVPGHRFGGDAIPDLPVDAVTPGFLSGTAGTAFLLARLYGVTRDERFLEAARRGQDSSARSAWSPTDARSCRTTSRRGGGSTTSASAPAPPGWPACSTSCTGSPETRAISTGWSGSRTGSCRAACPGPGPGALGRRLPVLRHRRADRVFRRPVRRHGARAVPRLRAHARDRPDRARDRGRRGRFPLVSGISAAAARRGHGRHRLHGGSRGHRHRPAAPGRHGARRHAAPADPAAGQPLPGHPDPGRRPARRPGIARSFGRPGIKATRREGGRASRRPGTKAAGLLRTA